MPDSAAAAVNKPLQCIAAITLADCKFRFRRTAGLVVLLSVAAGVYLIVPDIHSGVTLFQVDRHRVLYNSAAVAFGTGVFCSLLLTMVGYYFVSNSIGRDIVSRTGFLIAATRVTNFEYIAGKFLASTLYLTAIILACMVSAMGMFLLRGEGPLEPLVFFSTYCWLALPAILFSAAVGLAFESIPFLSGRIGDVVYFFVWAAVMAVPASFAESGSPPEWARMMDVLGFGLIIRQMSLTFHTTSVSIGQTGFNPSLPPVLYSGISWSWSMIGERLGSLGLPVIFLAIARASFHRFDPSRIKVSSRQSRRNPLTLLNAKLKPLTKLLYASGGTTRNTVTFAGAVRADAIATLALSPATLLAVIGIGIISLVVGMPALRDGLLPAATVVLVIALADIATRDVSAGMTGLLYAVPRIRSGYVLWKFVSALVITVAFTIIPLIRLLPAEPSSALSLLIGSCLLAAAATGFGVITHGRKLFVAVFLMMIYIALNARAEPGLDFAGFNGCATAGVQVGYAIATLFLLLIAHMRHMMHLRAQ